MILAAMLLALLSGGPTVEAVERLSPVEAGRALLVGQDHGPIGRLVRLPVGGMDPPGLVRMELLEQAVAVSGGCQRRRWEAHFVFGPAQPVEHASFESAADQGVEIAPARAKVCPDEGYVHLNPGIEAEEGFAALKKLNAAASGRVKITCRDETGSTLCINDQVTRRALGRLKPWAVSREAGEVVIWLGVRGGDVTEVRFGRRAARVHRKTPPPF